MYAEYVASVPQTWDTFKKSSVENYINGKSKYDLIPILSIAIIFVFLIKVFIGCLFSVVINLLVIVLIFVLIYILYTDYSNTLFSYSKSKVQTNNE